MLNNIINLNLLYLKKLNFYYLNNYYNIKKS